MDPGNTPNIIGVFLYRSVRREVPHIGNIMQRFRRPLTGSTIQLIHRVLAINIAAIIR